MPVIAARPQLVLPGHASDEREQVEKALDATAEIQSPSR